MQSMHNLKGRVVRQTGSQLMASWTGEFAVFSSDVSIPPAVLTGTKCGSLKEQQE